MARRRLTRAEKAAAKVQKDKVAEHEALFRVIQNDPIVCDTLERAIHLGDYLASAAPIWQKFGHMFCGKSAHELVNELLSWAGRGDVRPTLSPNFERVLQARKSKRSTYHTAKRRLVTYAGLNSSAINKEVFLATIPSRSCARLEAPFPPVHLYISEDESIFKRNAEFVLERGLPDWRKWRKRIYKLEDPTLLAHDLDPSQSSIFHDKDGLVAVVLRNACGLQSVVQFMDNSVKKVIDSRNNIRREDRGHISQMGLSAGALSHPMLGWVRNVAREKSNLTKHAIINYEASSAFAVLWGLARSLLPDEIIADFDAFLDKIGPDLRMDGNRSMGLNEEGQGSYTIKLGSGTDFEFHNAQLAPPCGVVAENYCRFVHYETQPHKWAVSLTTSRQFDSTLPPQKIGGHFYIASHGIRIQAAPNTLIAWRTSDWHGTSLFRVNPDDPLNGYYQRGLSFVTGNRLLGTIKQWRGLDEAALGAVVDAGAETLEEEKLDLLVAELRRSPRLAPKNEEFKRRLAILRAWGEEF